ncbi:MAG TPA: hypothetical protein VKF62_04425 [Planctomycetota bacterium]|nr:hypothetical protein [Planctomycetota bacterium]
MWRCPRCDLHSVPLRDPEEVDGELREMLRQASSFGCQEHLRARREGSIATPESAG